MTNTADAPNERDELLALLNKHRGLFLFTAQGLSDEQARLTPTASALSIGGLIKHVTSTTASWLDFIEGRETDDGASDWGSASEDSVRTFQDGFRLLPQESLAEVQDAYAAVMARVEEVVRTVDLSESHPLPEAPWFEKESWSNRRVLIHLVAETAQHAGHADIIRETIDGQKSMG